MFDQNIELASNKLVQFIQDLTANIQMIFTKTNFDKTSFDLFQLRCDYVKQIAFLFDTLIKQYIEEFHRNKTLNIKINLDPIQIWILIQTSIEQLNNIQFDDLCLIIKYIETINHYYYNLLLQIKSDECFKIDQICILNENLIQQLNNLSECLKCFITNIFHNFKKTDDHVKPIENYLFQNVSHENISNHNHHTNQSSPFNSNCYSHSMTNHLTSKQQATFNNFDQNFCCQSNPIRCTIGTNLLDCNVNLKKPEQSIPLCFSTPVIYTPEMETLFSSNGIIYARKSGIILLKLIFLTSVYNIPFEFTKGNTWVAENLGSLLETLKDVGKTIDMDDHCEILVRKTGDLFVRRKRAHRKRYLKEKFNNSNNVSKKTTIDVEQTDSYISDNNDQ